MLLWVFCVVPTKIAIRKNEMSFINDDFCGRREKRNNFIHSFSSVCVWRRDANVTFPCKCCISFYFCSFDETLEKWIRAKEDEEEEESTSVDGNKNTFLNEMFSCARDELPKRELRQRCHCTSSLAKMLICTNERIVSTFAIYSIVFFLLFSAFRIQWTTK